MNTETKLVFALEHIAHLEDLIEGNDCNMVGIDNGKIIFTPLDKALKGKSKINKELLRISQIMNT